MTAWARRKAEKAKKAAASSEETAKLIPELLPEGARQAYTSPIAPSSAFQIRNRLLSKMGTKVRGQVL